MSIKEVIDKLVSTANNHEFVSRYGICDILPYDFLPVFEKAYVLWPKYSGNLNYPVPHPKLHPREAYETVYDVWDVDTEYGRDRRELALWFADYLEWRDR